MTSRERVKKALNFEKPDRVPFNFWMDRRLLMQYEKKYGKDFRVVHYDADVIETFPQLDWPAGKGIERDGSFWYQEPYLKDWKDADAIKMPDPLDKKAYEHIMSNLYMYPGKAIFVNIPGPFTVLHMIRLLDNLYYDIYDYPDELHKLIKRVMDIQNIVIKNVVKLPITAVYFQDDVASATGLMFSVSMINEFILDYFKEGIDMAKKAGKHVIYHSDGNVTDMLDILADTGINAVNPMQPDFNDFKKFKVKYYGKLAVYGGIDNTGIIPDGSVEEVSTHIKDVFETLGKDGGLILSSHDIPLYCPSENIDIMVETIKKCKYK